MSHFFSFMLIKVIYIKRLSSFVVSPVPLLNSFNQKVTKQSYPLKKTLGDTPIGEHSQG